MVDTFPILRTLTQRQLEILHLKGVSVPDTDFRVVDLSQNLKFASVSTGKMPCITPDGAKFLTQQVRFLHGLEALRFMGIYMDEAQLVQHYSSSFLQDLAGNAYETSSCAANLLTSMVFLAHNLMCKRKASFPLQLPVCLGTQVDTRDQDQEDVEFNFCLTFLWQNASKSEPMSESKSESLFE